MSFVVENVVPPVPRNFPSNVMIEVEVPILSILYQNLSLLSSVALMKCLDVRSEGNVDVYGTLVLLVVKVAVPVRN